MDHFHYADGVLHCESLPVDRVAAQLGTPCYLYSQQTLIDHYDRLVDAFAPLDPLVCYSIKSCSNLSVCRLLAERGAGMDLVSGGELFRAVAAGADPAKCVFAGVGKTDAEIRAALETGVGWLNVESEAEFENIATIARSMNATCRAALRINPDVDPKTHRYTTTGKKETKFGVDIERARQFFRTYGQDEHCLLRGIHLHLGSPIYSADPYVNSIRKTLALIDELEAESRELGSGGAIPRIEMLDLGGGFGADYVTDQSPLASEYAANIIPLLEDCVRNGLKIVLEPGRTITANAGILLVTVQYVKTSGDKTFVITDGGMNVLLRPCHYDAFHFIWPARVTPEHVPLRREEQMNQPGLKPMDVVGPICETGDFFAIDRPLPPVKRGEVLAVFSAGAYGMVMASRYNTMPLPAEALVAGESVTIIRKRETYDDIVAHERNPQPVNLIT